MKAAAKKGLAKKSGTKAKAAKTKPATKRAKKKAKPIAARIEVPGVRPASFKFVERGQDSYELFRSSAKIGTARAEESGSWSARFAAGGKHLVARAGSTDALLKLVGTFLLASEARKAAARPVEEIDPGLKPKGRATAEHALSREFAMRAQKHRLAVLDALIKECRGHITAA